MEKVKIGVVGVGRGSSMINYCQRAQNAEVVAICDKWQEGLARKQKELGDTSISFYTDYNEFLNHEMDAVVLANYANEHAPFAIKAMEKGLHVFSEVLPVQCMKEAVELVECVQRTGKVYAYGENYCFMAAPREMRRLYREGTIGEFEYGEGEYVHNCEPIWPDITYGDPDHWRNHMYCNFYCTHSIGPLIHITGLRPVKVTGFELPFNARNARKGAKCGAAGIEMITLENGGIIKSIHGDLSKNSIWYTVYGKKGRMESAREDTLSQDVSKIFINADKEEDVYEPVPVVSYNPVIDRVAEHFGHSGSDYYAMYNFVEKVLGNKQADTIDVFEALDMFLPGLFAYFSVLAGGIPQEIPNMRDAAVRERYRHDTRCTDPKVAGDQLIPSYSLGNPEIPKETYEKIRQKWLKNME